MNFCQSNDYSDIDLHTIIEDYIEDNKWDFCIDDNFYENIWPDANLSLIDYETIDISYKEIEIGIMTETSVKARIKTMFDYDFGYDFIMEEQIQIAYIQPLFCPDY